MKKFIKQPSTIGLLLGVLIAFLFILIGFWKTILILLLSGVGWWIGNYMQKHSLSINDVFLIIKSILTR